MAETFNTPITELSSKLPELHHTMKIYLKYHLANKLLNNNVILGSDNLHEVGKFLTFKIQLSLGKKFQFQ